MPELHRPCRFRPVQMVCCEIGCSNTFVARNGRAIRCEACRAKRKQNKKVAAEKRRRGTRHQYTGGTGNMERIPDNVPAILECLRKGMIPP
jgi:hypothetical protein